MNELLKAAGAFAAIAVVIAWFASDTGAVIDLGKPSRTSASLGRAPSAGDVSLKRAANGHFYADADVNGTSVRMLADTGASLVVLGEDDAESVGLSPDSLDYVHSVQTANGRTEAALVVLDELRVGGIVRNDVRALVTRGLSGSLLGMSFFNTLSQVSMESDELILRD